MTPPPLFGANIDPSAADPREPFRRAQIAEAHGLDLIMLQDHPYNRHHLETWTLLTALAAATSRVHVGTNVLCTPLRPPAMIAKMAATLDILSGGRVEIGLGAGAFQEGIAAYGGPAREPADSLAAFEDALRIVRGMLESAGGSFRHEGRFYQVNGARPGPGPAHPIRIWTGATRPRAMRLTGRLADGVLTTNTYVSALQLLANNALLDEGAAQAGRDPEQVRRGYNLMGAIDAARSAPFDPQQPGPIVGPIQHWADLLVRLYRDYRQDTFIFWPVADDEASQIELFAREVVPRVRDAIEGR